MGLPGEPGDEMRKGCTKNRHFASGRQGLTGALAALLGMNVAAAAQAPAEDAPEAYDTGRAYIVDETIFVPFRPTEDDLQPLRAVLEDGALQPDTWLVIMERDAGRLAFVMDQMAYHHVAQGELKGEPWMVSF